MHGRKCMAEYESPVLILRVGEATTMGKRAI